MAADDTLNLLIVSALNSKGLDEYQQRLKQAQTGAQEAAAGAKELSTAVTDLGEKLLAAAGVSLGLAEGISFLKESFRAFVEGERLVTQFEAANEALGGQLGKNTQINKEWLRRWQRTSLQRAQT